MRNILIVEDDKSQREVLKKMLQEVDEGLNIYEASNKIEAINIYSNVSIDIFCIDVHLGDSSGIDLALDIRKIKRYEFSWMVFITTNVQYMLKAFKEIHCYDYILKPYEKEDIVNLTKKLISSAYMGNAVANERKSTVFEIRKGINVKIYVDEIIFIETNIRICTIHTKKRKYEIKGLSLKSAVELINHKGIIQCHKSFAVNIDEVRKVEGISSKVYEIYFEDYQEKAFLGYKFKNIFMERFI
ncbi:LytTR family DNA-binding domain-containing protein [Clostridium sp. MSJ-4]|uniref:LytTR family DNA-binding domain-containing protein n=1 Tax=Clostridium simiarum TaxID=2841506 RepID=A0ABS6EYB7_9CLOT|nr:LytTR family DNA-binding domain-containing protein [Clostridium simiarum]MBU5591226.1 LytTR family DNA-binding domain-containing protein [Clostridium simiarum]